MQTAAADFDEAAYLAANPDVAAAVDAGTIASGLTHYTRHGMNENRSLRPGVRALPLKFPFRPDLVPQRRDRILANLDLPALEGMEIGALTTPLVTPAEGDIRYVDHADTASLRDIYRTHDGVDISKIVTVDHVWGERTLQECIGSDRKVDYVVASHVIEHVPDLVAWFAEVRTVLRPHGSLRLAVPDRRFTFDYLRCESRIHDVLDAYLRQARTPLPRAVIEHHSLLRYVEVAAAWNGPLDAAGLQPYASTRIGLDLARDAIANGTYHDVHCWVFTPTSFAALCLELAELDLLALACDYFIDTAPNEAEFYVSMAPADRREDIVASWLGMHKSLQESGADQRPWSVIA